MLNFHILLALLHISVGLAASHNSCRQCMGNQAITFKTRVSQDSATSFFKASLGSCATGNDYYVQLVEPSDCLIPCVVEAIDNNKRRYCQKFGEKVCLTYKFNIRVWRYCGNGGSVTLNKGAHCSIQGFCVASDSLSLSCNRSVQCRGDCTCSNCGC